MGAWGEESCSNDSCWDALSVFNDIHEIGQEEVEPGLKVIFGTRMKWGAMEKLGSIIWLLRHGLEVPKKYLEKALPLVDACLDSAKKEGWRDLESRTANLHQEREDIKRALAGSGKIKPKHIPGLFERITGTMPGQDETEWGPDKSHAPDCAYRNKGECTCPKSRIVELRLKPLDIVDNRTFGEKKADGDLTVDEILSSEMGFGEKVCGLIAHGLSDSEIAEIILKDSDDAELLVARIRVLEREAGELQTELEMERARRFPIMGGPSIPWKMIEPHERQCQRNHGQSLEQIANRGGLSPAEALCVLDDASWRDGKWGNFTNDLAKKEKARKELERRRRNFEEKPSKPTHFSTDGSSGVTFTRGDVESVVGRTITRDEWARVRASRYWNKALPEILCQRGWEIIDQALMDAGIEHAKCKKCGSELEEGLCTDETCPYSDRQQNEKYKEE